MNKMAAIERDMLTGLPGRAASLARLDEWLAGSGPPVHAMVLSLGASKPSISLWRSRR